MLGQCVAAKLLTGCVLSCQQTDHNIIYILAVFNHSCIYFDGANKFSFLSQEYSTSRNAPFLKSS